MKYVITDNRIDENCEISLRQRGLEIIKLPCFPVLQEPVSAHPDMLLFLGEGRIVCHKDYFALAEKEISKISEITKKEIILSCENIGLEYPRDVLFNAAAVGDKLICRLDAASEMISEGYDVINVKQGYAKCSTCVVSDKAIITADSSIAKGAEQNGIDVLLVSSGGVRLNGYDCGFIGGASGADKDNVYFCGNVDLHHDGERIKEFCQKHGKVALSLSDEPLYDYGTLIFI